MSDPVFVAASYAVVLGGLGTYSALLGRRLRAAQRIKRELERQRGDGLRSTAEIAPAALSPEPTEAPLSPEPTEAPLSPEPTEASR
ncbi:MAG: hypothetical protein V4515_07445 [Chloroflexota bacterium]